MAGEDQVERIYAKLQLLVKKVAALQKENQRLKASLDSLQSKSASDQEKLAGLEIKNQVLKATRSTLTEEEKKSLDRKINLYVKEIDRCIAALKT